MKMILLTTLGLVMSFSVEKSHAFAATHKAVQLLNSNLNRELSGSLFIDKEFAFFFKAHIKNNALYINLEGHDKVIVRYSNSKFTVQVDSQEDANPEMLDPFDFDEFQWIYELLLSKSVHTVPQNYKENTKILAHSENTVLTLESGAVRRVELEAFKGLTQTKLVSLTLTGALQKDYSLIFDDQ